MRSGKSLEDKEFRRAIVPLEATSIESTFVRAGEFSSGHVLGGITVIYHDSIGWLVQEIFLLLYPTFYPN